jgi:chromosome segregation ATPase
MAFDELPEQCDAFVERVRVVCHQEVEKARAAVKALNAEKAATQVALAELQERRVSEQKQLDAVMKDLGRGSTLAGLNNETAAARTELARLKAETEGATKALEVLQKQRADAERLVVAAQNEIQNLRAERVEATTEIARVKALFGVAR